MKAKKQHDIADAARALLRELRKHVPQMTRTLARFVRAESPSTNKRALDSFARIVAAEWKRRGANVRVVRQSAAGDHVRVEWRAASPREAVSADNTAPILVLGHLDTVYAIGTLAKTPFRVRGGRAIGPGTFDMKSGLAIALHAVDALRALKLRPRRPIVFLWTSDEEIGSRSSRAAVEREARASSAVLVLEPAAGERGDLKTARKGVGEVTLEVTGRSSHAGLAPERGVNAVLELALQIARLQRFNRPKRGVSVSAGVIAGGTRANVIPDRATAQVDLRAPNVREMRALERKLRALRPILRGAKLAVRGGFNRPPLEARMSKALYARAARLARQMGLSIGARAVGGGSDGSFAAAIGVPTLDGMGGVGGGAHSPEEFVLLRSLPERAALLAAMLLEL
ncbi:MAG: M20/M25/M40 family metallo-hydrolase [Candidatus Acidiferrales bacterium]|jgi:glutamate carboxypeptidase